MEHFSFLSSPTALALGHTLLYSLWQAFIVFVCLSLILKLIPHAPSRIKYSISYFSYVGIALWFVITLILQLSIAYQAATYSETIGRNTGWSGILHQSQFSVFSFSFLNNYLSWIVGFYFMGMIWLATKLIFNFFQTDGLRKKGLTSLNGHLQKKIEELAEKLNVHKKVSAYFSKYIETPMMIGFFKPVILLPLATINHLSVQQFEAILLHELAHVRRNDYLLNLLQSILDTILFFNPFTWWITKYIRRERERSCDEMVLQISDPYHYARALLALEPLRNHALVMSAVGKRSQLLHRIKNIMEMKNNRINLRQKLVALLVTAIATFSVAWLSPKEIVNHAQPDLSNHPFTAPDFNANAFSKIFVLRDSNPPVTAPLPPSVPVEQEQQGNIPPPPPPVPPVPPVTNVPMPPVPPIPPISNVNGSDSVPDVTNYFNSKEWKRQQQEIQKSAAAMQKYFQSNAWKKQQQAIQKNSLALAKYFKSPEWMKQQKEIQKSAEKMKQYFNSPEWKKQQEEIQKNANNQIEQYFNSPEWKQQQEEIKKNAGKVQEYFNSPEWKKQEEHIRKSADSVTSYFKSEAWKKQQENIQKVMARTQKYFESAEWKKLQEEMKKAQLQRMELENVEKAGKK
jgi:beta-lactamase regulating signal transducer with metallopeptidase domain